MSRLYAAFNFLLYFSLFLVIANKAEAGESLTLALVVGGFASLCQIIWNMALYSRGED